MDRNASISELLEDRGYVSVELRPTPVGHLELDATVNGNAARMLVDTGAGVTVIDRARAQHWAVAGEKSGETAVAGCTGDIGGVENATVAALELAGLEITGVDVKIMDLSRINDGLEKHRAPRIDGIVGSDLMVGREAVIEYATNRLYLRKLEK